LEDDWTKLSKPRYDDKKGMIILELPQSNGREIKQPCLSQELKVTRGGELTLKSPSPASMISLNHPARLLLVLYDS
ncbi:MAG: hypothetical protein KDD42_04050, partial [Bdellovibrionales bacterium]|nr:hypothetical protein [Bdellovibrionales bacterium]